MNKLFLSLLTMFLLVGFQVNAQAECTQPAVTVSKDSTPQVLVKFESTVECPDWKHSRTAKFNEIVSIDHLGLDTASTAIGIGYNFYFGSNSQASVSFMSVGSTRTETIPTRLTVQN